MNRNLWKKLVVLERWIRVIFAARRVAEYLPDFLLLQFGKIEPCAKLNLIGSKSVRRRAQEISVYFSIYNRRVSRLFSWKAKVLLWCKMQFCLRQVFCEIVRMYRAGTCVGPGFTLSKVFMLRPTAEKDKRGLALDGQLKHEDTNLASSTMWEALLSQISSLKALSPTVSAQLLSSSLLSFCFFFFFLHLTFSRSNLV